MVSVVVVAVAVRFALDHCFFVFGRLVVPEADEGGRLDGVVQSVGVGGRRGGRFVGGRGESRRGGGPQMRRVPKQAAHFGAARLMIVQVDELVLFAGDRVLGHWQRKPSH